MKNAVFCCAMLMLSLGTVQQKGCHGIPAPPPQPCSTVDETPTVAASTHDPAISVVRSET